MYFARLDHSWDQCSWQTAAIRGPWLKDPESGQKLNPWERAKRRAGLSEEPPGKPFDLGSFDSFTKGATS